MIGMLYSFHAFLGDPSIKAWAVGVFLLVLTGIILTSKDKKKYLLFLIPGFISLRMLIHSFFGASSPAALILFLITAIIPLYYAFACASERITLPGGALLRADAVTDFKASGSVLGYLLFGIIALSWALAYAGVSPLAAVNATDYVGGFFLILTGILLFAVGKMRFTPVMFILTGFLAVISVYVSGPLYYVVGAMFIVLGLFAILRKESRILPAVMLIIYGCTYFFTPAAGEAGLPVVSIILNLIPALIAVYLAFAVFSQRKLPLF